MTWAGWRGAGRAQLTLVLSLAVGGCFRDHRNRAIDDLITRAAFDLDCPVGQLKLVPLGDDRFDTDRSVQVSRTMGVSGCERRATYLYDRYTWVMNNGTQQDPPAAKGN